MRSMRGCAQVLGAAVAALACTLAFAGAAYGAFPGQNGKIAFAGTGADGNQDIYLATPGVPGVQRLTTDPAADSLPAFSADGTMIAYASRRGGGNEDVYVMRSDGSGDARLTAYTGPDTQPAWSPDGTKIAFQSNRDGVLGIYVMASDGSNVTKLVDDGAFPAWSPDGTRIAFDRAGIRLVNTDGTGETSSGHGFQPDWSPDGGKLAFGYGVVLEDCGLVDDGIYWGPVGTMGVNSLAGVDTCAGPLEDVEPVWSPDGARIAWTHYPTGSAVIETQDLDGGAAATIDDLPSNAAPDWQPVQPGYARPKGATPFRASLVPAYIACTAANTTHGSPLAFGSCKPPTARSVLLTTGTPDANGAEVGMVGSASFNVMPGDVAVSVRVSDVRCRAANPACPGGPLSDYTGRLLLLPLTTRITDRSNTPPGPQGAPGTGDTQIAIPVDCGATASTAVGSTCAVTTTLDTLIPGTVVAGRRAIWEFGQLNVRDAGPNGTGYGAGCPPTCGDGDETLFLREGVFVP